MKTYVPYILMVLLLLSACDSSYPEENPEEEMETFSYTLEGSMTVENTIFCYITYSTSEEQRKFTAGGLTGRLSIIPIDSATAIRADCSGRSDTGTLRMELFADSVLVAAAETASPNAGVVVEHGDTSSL